MHGGNPMRMSQDMGVLVVVALLCGLWPAAGWGQDMSPDQAIRLSQHLLRRNPRDARAYYRLGDAYIQKAREGGDVTYITLAEQALRKALDLAPHLSGAARHLAYVFYYRHAFEAAAAQAARAIELDTSDSHAYGILGDAYLEVGKYEQAQQAYQQMIQLQGDLYAYSRLAGLKSLRGDTDGARGDLERAVHEGQVNRRPPESIAWVQWQLGSEHFALGHLQEAETQYLAALTSYPNYYRALTGLAQVRVAQQRYPEAITLYQQAIGIIPLPDYAGALGDVYRQIGRPEEAQKQYDLVEYIGRLNALNNILYNRELAYFYADHDMKLQEALVLARKELEVRRDIYAYDLLAWALYKNDRPQEALVAMTEALKLGTRDARLLFHAGMMHQRLGNTAPAQDYLRRALATNPYFHIVHAELADQTLKHLEEQLAPEPLRERRDGQ
jgi:tetratricopeptide (TPR) repeat protein